uniref:Uncharacterized protein n=1 Tax=Mycoplasma feriruminatoris TaxID=1179777 RepID=A0A654IKZ5_9MOLU|nr:hypothetical protein MF5582_00015 [Mycoplasma feriruminatoris]
MKKATKLLLSILPISSIGFLSVVSCSTTKKPDNQNKPNNNNPNLNNSSSGNQTNPNDSTAPNENNTPSQPENQPNNNENTPNTDPKKPESEHKQPESPKKPEEPKKPEDKPQADQPQGEDPNAHNEQPPADKPVPNQPNEHKVDFSDIDKLSNEISLEHFTSYKNKSLESAWSDLQKDSTVFSHIFFKNIKGYNISFENTSSVKFDHSKGVIDNVKIKFTKQGQSKTRVFAITGLKKTDSVKPNGTKNNKENYIKPRSINKELSGLFPSLLAYMLLFVENDKKYEEIQWDKNSINFDELKNKNTDLFDESFVGFNAGTKELLFEYNENDRTKYEDKIINAKYDDITGELGLEVEIKNREESNLTEANITKSFSFKGFRKINFNNQNNNVFSLSLLPSDLKEIAGKGILKSTVSSLLTKKEFNKKFLSL